MRVFCITDGTYRGQVSPVNMFVIVVDLKSYQKFNYPIANYNHGQDTDFGEAFEDRSRIPKTHLEAVHFCLFCDSYPAPYRVADLCPTSVRGLTDVSRRR